MNYKIPGGYVKQRIIVCAANRSRTTGQIILGVRHWDEFMIAQFNAIGAKSAFGPAEQGFIDQHGAFLNRQEAWKVAEEAGQIRHRDFDDGTLYSENLY